MRTMPPPRLVGSRWSSLVATLSTSNLEREPSDELLNTHALSAADPRESSGLPEELETQIIERQDDPGGVLADLCPRLSPEFEEGTESGGERIRTADLCRAKAAL